MSPSQDLSSPRPAAGPRPAKAGFASGFVAILGRPNVGKSTLLNRVLGEKLAIVSPRPQTTRERLLGVANLRNAQLALVDTPGLHRPGGRGRTLLNRYMVDEALAALTSVDVVLLVADLRTEEQSLRDRIERAPRPGSKESPDGKPLSLLDPADRFVVQELAKTNKPVVLAINKVDLVRDKALLLPLIAEWSSQAPFRAVVPISAQTGEGVDRLLDELVAALPAGGPLFDKDTLTDRSERFLVAERVREQVFQRLRQELPYAVAVTIDSWEERIAPEGKRKGERIGCAIDATIHVEKPNQKKILVGEHGQMIRDIGTDARKEVGELLGCPVHLALFVRVDADWSQKPGGLREMGYDLQANTDKNKGAGAAKRQKARRDPRAAKPGRPKEGAR
jgi:GTP-binding protein Era